MKLADFLGNTAVSAVALVLCIQFLYALMGEQITLDTVRELLGNGWFIALAAGYPLITGLITTYWEKDHE